MIEKYKRFNEELEDALYSFIGSGINDESMHKLQDSLDSIVEDYKDKEIINSHIEVRVETGSASTDSIRIMPYYCGAKICVVESDISFMKLGDLIILSTIQMDNRIVAKRGDIIW